RSGGGGGASGGGGGSAADAGRIVWRQARDGFDGIRTVSCGGCGIDAGQRDAGNVVWAHVPGAGVMRVVAYTGDQGQIPPVTRGRFKGRFRVPASAFPGGNSGFACVASQTASFVINLFLQTNHLGVYSGPGVVADAQSTDVATPSLSADTWYTVEVAWQQGVSRDLWLDGVKVAHVTGSTITVDAGATVVPAEFRLGINSYNGTSGGPWSVELRDFTYSDDPDAALP
ncbi:MAG: hypothetical protein K1X89_26245, partial [Myxococcaceae bacterium]|nr:hypothetical protein [Myxococcaceae bacterium]